MEVAGGAPLALSNGLSSARGVLEDISQVFSLGMSATVRWGIDIGLTGAEAIGCSVPSGH